MSAAPLSLDLDRDDARPYFLWDTSLTVGELRDRLAQADEGERLIWIGRIMREARFRDVWLFLDLDDILPRWERLRTQLGRKTAFWEFLLRKWQEHGLIAATV